VRAFRVEAADFCYQKHRVIERSSTPLFCNKTVNKLTIEPRAKRLYIGRVFYSPYPLLTIYSIEAHKAAPVVGVI
jgi:hypothetical protein